MIYSRHYNPECPKLLQESCLPNKFYVAMPYLIFIVVTTLLIIRLRGQSVVNPTKGLVHH